MERGRDEPPVLSCQCFLCRWGRRSAKSLYPTHTDTHASLYNGCFTLVPEREGLRQRGDMVRRRNRDMEVAGYTEKESYDIQKRELRKMLERCGGQANAASGKMERSLRVIRPIKRGNRRDSLGAIWSSYWFNWSIAWEDQRMAHLSQQQPPNPRSPFHCRCQLGGIWMCLWQRFIRNDS